MSGAAYNRGGSKQDYETPPDFMDAVVRRYGSIDFDLAAHAGNKKSENYFGPGSPIAEDALAQSWDVIDGNIWLNPPYDRIGPWARRCAMYKGPGRILFLVPASVGSNWFANFVYERAMVQLLNGRVTFVGHSQAFPKDLILGEYRNGRPVANRTIFIWRWTDGFGSVDSRK